MTVLNPQIISKIIGNNSGWFLFEIFALVSKYAITRLVIDILGIIIAYLLQAFISKDEIKKIYDNAEKLA